MLFPKNKGIRTCDCFTQARDWRCWWCWQHLRGTSHHYRTHFCNFPTHKTWPLLSPSGKKTGGRISRSNKVRCWSNAWVEWLYCITTITSFIRRRESQWLCNKAKKNSKTTSRHQNTVEYIAGKSFLFISLKEKLDLTLFCVRRSQYFISHRKSLIFNGRL